MLGLEMHACQKGVKDPLCNHPKCRVCRRYDRELGDVEETGGGDCSCCGIVREDMSVMTGSLVRAVEAEGDTGSLVRTVDAEGDIGSELGAGRTEAMAMTRTAAMDGVNSGGEKSADRCGNDVVVSAVQRIARAARCLVMMESKIGSGPPMARDVVVEAVADKKVHGRGGY